MGSFVRDFDLDLKISSVSKNNFHISILQKNSPVDEHFYLDYSECHCFRLVTRMAEANVGPPESAPDESGSGEEQKEEKAAGAQHQLSGAQGSQAQKRNPRTHNAKKRR